jgi:hypothetical protein
VKKESAEFSLGGFGLEKRAFERKKYFIISFG